MGQADRLANWLESGRPITRLTALTELGIFELSARVIDLEARGYVIPRRTIKVLNRWGEACRVTEYAMANPDANATMTAGERSHGEVTIQ